MMFCALKKFLPLLCFIQLAVFCDDRRTAIYQYMPKGGVGCEVGVYEGDFSELLIENTAPEKLYLIDPWSVFRQGTANNGEADFKSQKDWDAMYESVRARYAHLPHVEIIRERGEAAAGLFDNETFDWIYVDGDHSYEGAFVDFFKYFPKLKQGGVMIADDYPCNDVRQAFTDFRKICKEVDHIRVEGSQLIVIKKVH